MTKVSHEVLEGQRRSDAIWSTPEVRDECKVPANIYIYIYTNYRLDESVALHGACAFGSVYFHTHRHGRNLGVQYWNAKHIMSDWWIRLASRA